MRNRGFTIPNTTRAVRRGWGVVQLLGAIFAGTLVLGACVPLFMAAQREADVGMVRARMTTTAREISARLREDVRQATDVQVTGGGDGLQLTQTRVATGVRDRITYRRTAKGLVRDVTPGDGARPAERSVFTGALSQCRFARQQDAVSASLSFASRVNGRPVQYRLDCTATPRSAL